MQPLIGAVEAGGTKMVCAVGTGPDDIRDEVRGENAAFAAENPKASLAANLVGGVATGGATMAAAKGAGALGTAARTLAPRVEATASLGQRLRAAAQAGGVGGAIGGAGVAEELRDVPESAGLGSVYGAIAGGVLAGAGELVQGARNMAGQSFAARGRDVEPVRGRELFGDEARHRRFGFDAQHAIDRLEHGAGGEGHGIRHAP
jgi:hypothetical protein